MWVLEIRAGIVVRRYLLVGGVSYSIGRKDCDILLPPNDPSISRAHATLTVVPTAAADLVDLASRPSVLLGDCSKHGTFVNKQRLLAVDRKREILEGDEIIFGRTVSASIHFAPAMVAASATLSASERDELTATVCKIGGYLSLDAPFSIDDVIKARLSPFVFLYVTKQVNMESSAMMAMMDRYCLVNALYPQRLYETIRDGCTIDLNSLPQPGGFDAARNALLSKAPYCRPDPSLFDAATFRTTDHRAHGSTFRLVHFIFLDAALYQHLLPVVRHGGGKATLISTSDAANFVRQERLADGTQNPLPLRGLVGEIVSHGLNSYVVLPPLEFDDILSSISNGESAQRTISASHRAYIRLWANELPLVHAENLLLAVYSEDTPSQLSASAPGVLVKQEMTYAADEDDKDSAATEDGILPSAGLIVPQPIRLVPAEQVFEKPVASPHREIQTSPSTALVLASPPVEQSLLGTSEALYERWSAFNDRAHLRETKQTRELRLRQERITRTISPALSGRTPPAVRIPAAAAVMDAPREHRVITLCNDFTARSLPFMEQQVEQTCSTAYAQNYVTPSQRTALETALHRVQAFKSCLSSLLLEAREGPLSEATAQRVNEVNRRVEVLLQVIRNAMTSLQISSSQKPIATTSKPATSRHSSPARGSPLKRGESPSRSTPGATTPQRRARSPVWR